MCGNERSPKFQDPQSFFRGFYEVKKDYFRDQLENGNSGNG
uniref:Uncharacterized protein n=1 Tax=Pithovirus LCPAC304 TaxID=2506594 RepID=A0A481Z8A4_9VIRU|nr:MAG: hypothetical protein LCPAC304_04950 [Pithovirus LCPAC304]